ncbi:MAG: RluA family pseudouridine synthase [Clostridia bacterium]|nr:RluA family pseudouridine synthase [Clostridia bacterium]
MSRNLKYVIEKEFDDKRVMEYLRGKLRFSSRLIKLLKKQPDGIMLNSFHARTIDPICCGDVLEINIPDDETPALVSDVNAPVVYADDDVIVFNKPAFMPVHPTRNHQGDTLANVYASYLAERGLSAAFRPINRLDRDTTGLVVCGINQYSASRLTGNVEKVYYAVACGRLDGSGTIDAPIARCNERFITREVAEHGDRAVTHWEAVQHNADCATLLRITLETGRTHQIRVHFSHIGHALVGDTMYGVADKRITRQALHCASVRFIHPVSEREIIIETEIPDDMNGLMG